jgi:DNA-binding LytR/AlgR family response regulator
MSKPNIICVDDEKIVLDSLKEQLNSTFGCGYNIETAESGREALGVFQDLLHQSGEVPLIIADYIMPGMKGDELLKRVREIDPKVVSILLTGQATIEGVANAVNYGGVFRYIAKPWDGGNLCGIVTEALQYYYGERLYEEKIDKLKIINCELQQTLVVKTRELELNRRFLEPDNEMDLMGQPVADISTGIYNLLVTIKSGIDMIHDQKTNLQEPQPNSSTPPHYIRSVNEFYRVTSDILGNLAESFNQNTLAAARDDSREFFDNGIVNLMNHKISAVNRHLSENLQELTRRVNTMEQQFTRGVERIAAWDDEEIVILDLNEVLFFTSENSQTYVVIPKAKYKIRDTLDILETRLCGQIFFRCHRGFIINLNHISKISPWLGSNNYISTFEGLSYEIPISRNRIKEMKRLLEIS